MQWTTIWFMISELLVSPKRTGGGGSLGPTVGEVDIGIRLEVGVAKLETPILLNNIVLKNFEIHPEQSPTAFKFYFRFV